MSPSRRVAAWSVALILCILASCGGEVDPVEDLEGRLFAPCCWRQSLRDHEAPLATQLRAEIRSRITAGEPAGVIEADLVRRYGERIRALPQGGDPRWIIAVAVVLACAGGLLLLVHVGRRRRPVAAGATTGTATTVGVTAFAMAGVLELASEDADRLDDELALID